MPRKNDDNSAEDLVKELFGASEDAAEALEKEMKALSLEEHERALFDVHGIRTTVEVEEKTLKISEQRKELDTELTFLPKSSKSMYLKAKELNNSYVENESFQLMFLRAARFDVKRAAALLAHHFEVKYEIFVADREGVEEDILVRDVHWSDLNEEDQTHVMSGFYQVSPHRDASGRVVTFIASNIFQAASSARRAYWFMAMSIAGEEATQKNGLVHVVTNFEGKILGIEDVRIFRRTETAIPLPIVSGHFCCRSSAYLPVVSTYVLLFLDQFSRLRLTPHWGAPDAVAFELQTFGIQVLDDGPWTSTGDVATSVHHQWIEMLKAIEKRGEVATGATIVPGRFDVLFGKTMQAREHTGNLRCHHLVEMHAEKYDAAGRKEKTALAGQIVRITRESGGRFLKWDSGIWVEADEKTAREKVSHFFRNRRIRLATASKKATKRVAKA